MSKILWKSLLVCPAVLGAALAIVQSAVASTGAADLVIEDEQKQANVERPVVVAQVQEGVANPAANTSADDTMNQVNTYSNEGKGSSPTDANTIAQVTSVSQLSDVQPTDWAFQALQSLVERYGCIAGYPDGTYRGNRAMTRYEFAAGLNACLDRVNELIATATADKVTKEDLATLQRLQEEFATELATLRGRVDTLEVATAELEANQFSTTTKLVGEVIGVVTDEFGNNGVNNNTVLQSRARLDFQTSFTGRDTLHTRLNMGNGNLFNLPGGRTLADGTEIPGTFEGTQVSNQGDTDNSVVLDWAAYQFPLFGNGQVYLAAVGGLHSDYVPTVNPYFEGFTGGSGALSAFAERSPIYNIGGGAGGGINFPLGSGGGILGNSSLSLGYLADNPNLPDDSLGFTNGDFSALAQLNFNLGDRFAVAATYVRGYHNAGDGIFDLGGSASRNLGSNFPIEGSAEANDPSLVDGALGSSRLSTDSYGLSAALRLSDRVSISGWVMKSDIEIIDVGDADVWSYALGVAFPDLGKEGSVLGIIAGVQPTLRSVDAPGAVDFDNDYGYHIEGFYKYQLTDNISITPGVIWLTSPGQSTAEANDSVIGTLRTTFTF
ncbi:iron uptake porin [Aliterella atlantica]|uniref:Membrane protein n=1 Tax=Aliterella atlantica CENA595 TaxID=1618023 RepID=A0A0D8ZWM1_9CYAN|nr:iron uptake porin [Aliterella atlantica]KJH71636.1 membrane protein [Aliterella atlantica CENA595]